MARQVAGETIQTYFTNGHGDVMEIRNAQGEVLNTYTYDIWGNPLAEEEKTPNVLRYASQYWDKTTKLQYLRARWYDPSIGRFINEDPYHGELSQPLSLNLYTYVGNNPLTRVDPSGNAWETILDVWSIGSSVVDLWNKPSWGNAGYLAWDVAAAAVPFVPGSYTAKAAKLVNKAVSGKVVEKASKVTKGRVIENQLDVSDIIVKPLGRGNSRGRTVARNLKEQLAMKEIMCNPAGGRPLKVPMTDPRWLAKDGWAKMAYNVNDVEIHYLKNIKTGHFDDFKFIDRRK